MFFQYLAGCPAEWLNYKDKCYFFSKDLQSFDHAKTTCESMSGSLLIINDMEEQVSRTSCNLTLLSSICEF